jgi:hypothetical protein
LQWSVPRELLWAIIGSLTVFVIALWPSHYPYSHVYQQHQFEYGVSGGDLPKNDPAVHINPSSKEQRDYGGEYNSEFVPLGIKPGEWLLSIVTLMLWGATVGLVRSAERTSERQLRAYIDAGRGTMRDFEIGKIPTVKVRFKNTGQTPARNLRINTNVIFLPINRFKETLDMPLEEDGGSNGTLGAGGRIVIDLDLGGALTAEHFRYISEYQAAIYVFGLIRYNDVSGRERQSRFQLEFTSVSLRNQNNRLQTCAHGNHST